MALTNSQYDAIMRIYQQRQLHNHALLLKRQEEIAKKLPAYAMLKEEIISLSMSEVKRQLLSNEDSFIDTKEAIQSLKKDRENLLVSNGYPKDYLEEIYTCKDCQDTGYVQGRKCHCFRQAEIEMLYAQSNIQALLKEENFDSFELDYYSKDYVDTATGENAYTVAMKAYDVCYGFVKHFDLEFENLLLYGDVGVGKTFLTHCVANALLESGHSVIYFTGHQLFDTLAEQRFGTASSNSIPEAYQHIFQCDLLIIDDLGTEMTNSFSTSQLFLCINERFLRKKSTMISTNLSPRNILDTYSERTFSRISGNYKLLKLIGEDIRMKKRLGNA
ncbi:MAG: ATP-binding protein [Lachnospiraceae bacterium]|nr:ATP-binding protein [Lachnospiraceae bacterium]